MLCRFKQLKTEWICENCGRRVPRSSNDINIFMPTARCRIPDNYRDNNNFINKKQGVGDSLSQILKQMNISYDTVSIARSKINFLNSKSIDWCEHNQHLIIDFLKEEAELRRIPFIKSKFKALVRLAIKKSKLIIQ